MMVVVVDVMPDAGLQLVNVAKVVEVIELGFERTEEALHRGIVQTVTFARHTLRHSLFLQSLAIRRHAVVPSLIRVKHWLLTRTEARKRPAQHRANQVE